MRIDRGAGGTAARHPAPRSPRSSPGSPPSPVPATPLVLPFPGCVFVCVCVCPPPPVSPLRSAPGLASFPRRLRRRGRAQGAGGQREPPRKPPGVSAAPPGTGQGMNGESPAPGMSCQARRDPPGGLGVGGNGPLGLREPAASFLG